jgi:hypothetical protein
LRDLLARFPNPRHATLGLRFFPRQAFDEFMQGMPDVQPADFDDLPGGLNTGR